MLIVPSSTFVYSGVSITPPVIQGYKEVGALPPSTYVLVTFSVPLRNQQLLSYYATQIATPDSSLYHHFLSQQQVSQLFYPVDSYKSLLSYLTSNGINVVMTAADSIIVASGSEQQFSQLLGLSFSVYSNGTYTYYSAEGNAKLQGIQVYSSNVTSVLFAHPNTLLTEAMLKSLHGIAQQFNQTFAIESYPLTSLSSVYNATYMYSKGIDGKGYTIGILDFYGDPYIASQLQYFDQLYGLPDPPSFSVVPIGPYDPNLGINTGWADEISLDVETAHSMAPGADLKLYVANGALPLSAVIAFIQQQNAVNDLSQSFTIPESYLSSLGASSLYFNVVLTDEYYMLGSVEGITFLAATGDAGGSGYSTSPWGTPGYPATSPFVTSVGGTTTYITFGKDGVIAANQTAWSNYGFVPLLVNYGGSTGGVSIFEPKPWYQAPLETPASYPSGRMIPDVSLNANVFPGVNIIGILNQEEIAGGTSESCQLLAGLLALVMQYDNSTLGLINPAIYSMAQNKSIYSEAFTPISFGYNIPWTANPGYNLVTGWGSLNIANFAKYYSELTPGNELSIQVNLNNSSGITSQYFLPGQQVFVTANITGSEGIVTSGSFSAVLSTSLNSNITAVPLSYDPSKSMWSGSFIIPQGVSGMGYVTVSGSSSGVSGFGLASAFLGYVITYSSPSPFLPYSASLGITLHANITDLYGNPVNYGQFFVYVYSYDLQNNQYMLLSTIHLSHQTVNGTSLWIGQLAGDYPSGAMMLVGNGAYGYLPIINGIDMQSMFLLPPVVAEPGGVAPGQAITIYGNIIPPLNTLSTTSNSLGTSLATAISYGSNITADLVSPSGSIIASTAVNVYQGNTYYGTLFVPQTASKGLYTILLKASYGSQTLGMTFYGSYFGQIYVNGMSNVSIIVSPAYAFEGSRIYIYANITDQYGHKVTNGMYSASIYPTNLRNSYSIITTLQQIPLWFNATLGLWVGNATLASTNDLGAESYLGSPGYYSGEYQVFISGVSPDAMQTSTDQANEHGFFILPYLLIQNEQLRSNYQTFESAYTEDIFYSSNASFTHDVFYGVNTFQDGVYNIDSSEINGTLRVIRSNITLSGVEGDTIVSVDSNITLIGSNVKTLILNASTLRSVQSSFSSISPPPPTIDFISPGNLTSHFGSMDITINVSEQDIRDVNVYLNNVLIHEFNHGGLLSYSLDTLSLPDGSYTLKVVATQYDGISSVAFASVFFINRSLVDSLLIFLALGFALFATVLLIMKPRKNAKSVL